MAHPLLPPITTIFTAEELPPLATSASYKDLRALEMAKQLHIAIADQISSSVKWSPTMKTHLIVCAISSFLLASCAADADRIGKPKDGKQDATEKLCKQAGEPENCDICEVQGWYGDGECDDFCPEADADCSMSGVREANPLCDPRLDSWMFECIDRNIASGENPVEAMEFCVGGVHDGEPLEIDGICNSEACFIELSSNAEVCGEAILKELSESIAFCDPRLEQWMYDCFDSGFEEGDKGLDEVRDGCVSAALDGEVLELDGICDSAACLEELAENAVSCGEAVRKDFE
jgi:hypothetical protein